MKRARFINSRKLLPRGNVSFPPWWTVLMVNLSESRIMRPWRINTDYITDREKVLSFLSGTIPLEGNCGLYEIWKDAHMDPLTPDHKCNVTNYLKLLPPALPAVVDSTTETRATQPPGWLRLNILWQQQGKNLRDPGIANVPSVLKKSNLEGLMWNL